MENILIAGLLAGGLICSIYFISQFVKMTEKITVVDMGDKKHD